MLLIKVAILVRVQAPYSRYPRYLTPNWVIHFASLSIAAATGETSPDSMSISDPAAAPVGESFERVLNFLKKAS